MFAQISFSLMGQFMIKWDKYHTSEGSWKAIKTGKGSKFKFLYDGSVYWDNYYTSGGRWEAIKKRLIITMVKDPIICTTINYHQLLLEHSWLGITAFRLQPSAFSIQYSAFTLQPKAFGVQPSALHPLCQENLCRSLPEQWPTSDNSKNSLLRWGTPP